jgi:PTS system fructose-specific IIC component
VDADERKHLLNFRKHLLTGVSYMIPLVILGGISIALSFLVGGYLGFKQEGTVADYLMRIGGTVLGLVVPIMAMYIAYSIADRVGMAAGLAAGLIAVAVNAGFLGGLIGGLLAGYLVYYMKKISPPKWLKPLMNILFIPLVSGLIMGGLMFLVIGPPVAAFMTTLAAWLKSLSAVNKFVFGGVLGMMQAIDMGGPIDKTAYTFGVAMLDQKIYGPMAAVMVGGMTPPIALTIAAKLFPKKFATAERRHADAAWLLGLSFITEGAIPFASADPLRVIPAQMVGSFVAGGISMAAGVELMAPHGGIFVFPLVNQPFVYLLALVVGVALTAAIVILLKPDLKEDETAEAISPTADASPIPLS